MSFGSPLMLWGLLAMAVPIIVHLTNRRRAVRVRFPAIALLLASKEQLARRLKVRQALLLALRVALFALLPIAMARPTVGCGGDEAAHDGRAPTSVVIVVDDSGSMSTPVGRENAWQAAVDEATRLVGSLRAWDQVAIVVCSASAEPLVAAASADRTEPLRRLHAHTPRFAASRPDLGLAEAAALHAAAAMPAQATVVLTDGHDGGWDRVASAGRVGALRIVDVTERGADPVSNLAVRDVRLATTPRGAAQISVDVWAWGASAGRSARVVLEVDGERAATADVEVRDGSTLVQFERSFERGAVYALTLRVDDGVGPTVDDVVHAGWDAASATRVLLVNGDPSALAQNDEVFFVEQALAVTRDGEAPEFQVVSTTTDRLDAASIAAADVVAVANVDTLASAQVEALRSFVEGGGGLLLTGGDRVDVTTWNGALAPLLPKPIRAARQLARADDPDAAIRATRVGAFDALHPVLRAFATPGGESLLAANVYGYLLVEPGQDREVTVPARFVDGAPALLERRLGRGVVLLWTSTLDTGWTDLPLRTAFVPFVRRMASYVARRGGGDEARVAVGEVVDIELRDPDPRRVTLTLPTGEEVVLDAAAGRARVPIAAVGRHEVTVSDASGHDDAAAVVWGVADVTEQDPARLRSVRVAELEGQSQSAGGEGGRGEAHGRSIWPTLLFVALVVLYLESLVSVRQRGWARVRAALAAVVPFAARVTRKAPGRAAS